MNKQPESYSQLVSSKMNKTMNHLLIILFGVYPLGSISAEAINKKNEDGSAVFVLTKDCKGGPSCRDLPTSSRTDWWVRKMKYANLN